MSHALLKVTRFALVLAVYAILAGCGTLPKQPEPQAKNASCDGPKLPGTGICEAKAASYLQFAGGPRPKAPTGCQWVVNELALPGDEFLLYLAARCGGKTHTLAYSGGAQKAELKFDGTGAAIVEIFAADGGDGSAAILRHTRAAMSNPADAAKCAVRPAKIESWPTDAMVVDVSAAEVAKIPKDGPRTACGTYGLDEDSQMFWRAFQGFAWYFNLGQEEPEIDPGSFTVLKKDASGNWVRVNA